MLQYLPGHVSVFGWFEEKEAVISSDGLVDFRADLCPHELLRKLVEYVFTHLHCEAHDNLRCTVGRPI